MTLYLLLMTSFNNGIQALQHWWEKWVNRTKNYVQKLTLFGHFPWEYRSQPMNYSVDPQI